MKETRCDPAPKHGAVAVGATLAAALETAIKIEEAARLLLLSRQFGPS